MLYLYTTLQLELESKRDKSTTLSILIKNQNITVNDNCKSIISRNEIELKKEKTRIKKEKTKRRRTGIRAQIFGRDRC